MLQHLSSEPVSAFHFALPVAKNGILLPLTLLPSLFLKKLLSICKKIKSIFKEPSFLIFENLECNVSWALKKVLRWHFWKHSEEWQYYQNYMSSFPSLLLWRNTYLHNSDVFIKQTALPLCIHTSLSLLSCLAWLSPCAKNSFTFSL